MDHRFHRQELLIPRGMRDATVLLVGLGMLGSWTAHALSRTVKVVHGWDFDSVGPENIGTQAYDELALDFCKSDAMAARLTGLPFVGVCEPFESSLVIGADLVGRHEGHGPLVVVSAVDSFAGRRMLAEWAAKHADLFIDTRAAGTVGVVVTVPIELRSGLGQTYSHEPVFAVAGPRMVDYIATLESDETAPAPQCGAEGTAFVGLWVAATVASTLVRYFKGLPVPYKVVRDVAMDEELVHEDSPAVPIG